MTIEGLIKSGKAHITSYDGLRRMFYDDGEWQVWGQRRKYDRTHLMYVGRINDCIDVLMGEYQANTIANEQHSKANG